MVFGLVNARIPHTLDYMLFHQGGTGTYNGSEDQRAAGTTVLFFSDSCGRFAALDVAPGMAVAARALA